MFTGSGLKNLGRELVCHIFPKDSKMVRTILELKNEIGVALQELNHIGKQQVAAEKHAAGTILSFPDVFHRI